MTPLILECSCRYTPLPIDEPVDKTHVDVDMVMMMLQLHRIVRACQVAFP